MAALPNVCLNLSNRAENVLLVRQVLTGTAEAVGLAGSDLNDIRTAVTEACNNVVLHAYGGEEGPLEVELYAFADAIEVVVRDHGSGIGPPLAGAESQSSAGLGLPVIAALAHRVEFGQARGGGSEVRMEFATAGTRALGSFPAQALAAQTLAAQTLAAQTPRLPAVAQASELASTMGIAIAPTPLARTVLPRLLSALAARAQLSTDRISDAQLVADALVAQTPESIEGSQLGVGIRVQPRNLELSIGPLRASRASWRMVDSAVAGLDPVVERLTSRQDVVAAGCSEALSLQLSEEH